jgi:hypothetical protein
MPGTRPAGDGVRLVRGLLAPSTLCIVMGLVGGLGLGYVLSRQGTWLTPAPWIVYLAALLMVIAAVSWLDERRRSGSSPAADGSLALPGDVGTGPAANVAMTEAEPKDEEAAEEGC